MSDLSDLPILPGLPVSPAARDAKLETLALSLARSERMLGELETQMTLQQGALAKTRKLLVEILWPRHEQPKGI